MATKSLVTVALVLSGCGGGEAAVTSAAGVRLVKVGTFDDPVNLASPPGDTRRQFVVEQGGRVMVIRAGKKLARPFLDIRRLVTAGGEQGLLSIAFAPDYATTRRFYVYFTDNAEQQRVVEYRAASAERADPGSARLVLRMADDESNHNGGQLVFGPDGLLYIGTGDGGGGGDQHGAHGNAQNLGSLLGKILRIDPRRSGRSAYSVPSDNPFTGRRGARREIFAYGLRNPWRFSFDRTTHALLIGDVGQNEVEEIDYVPAAEARGANFGWRVWEGRERYDSRETAPGAIFPIYTNTHPAGNCSITGGFVVRDRALRSLYGRYVFGDFCRGQVLSLKPARPRARDVRSTGLKVPSLSSFGEDASGRVYALSLDGAVYRLSQPKN